MLCVAGLKATFLHVEDITLISTAMKWNLLRVFQIRSDHVFDCVFENRLTYIHNAQIHITVLNSWSHKIFHTKS